MSDFLTIAKKRYSCRHYDTEHIVTDADVDRVLEAARIAPSACNRQPWRFIVVRDAGRRAALLAKSRPAFNEAPVLIAAVGLHDRAWVRPADHKDHTDIDMAIAVQQICLQAADMGLATCWICSFDAEAAHSILNLPEHAECVALIPLGYPLDYENPTHDQRLSLDEIRRCETF